MATEGVLVAAQKIFALKSWTERYPERVNMSLLERLTCCSRRPPKKHVGGESNLLTDKSKLRKKVYVSILLDVPKCFIINI